MMGLALPAAPVVLKTCRCGALFTQPPGEEARVCPACDARFRAKAWADTHNRHFFRMELDRKHARWLELLIWRD